MPKRKKLSQIIFSGELPETSGEKRQGLFRRLTSRFTGGHVVRSTRFAAAPAPAAYGFKSVNGTGETGAVESNDVDEDEWN